MSGRSADNEMLYKLWSVMAFGACSKQLDELSSLYDSAEELYTALKEDGGLRSRLNSRELKEIDRHTLENAGKMAELCQKKNIAIITDNDGLYPEMLRNISIPPKVIFCRGDISGMDQRLNIGIVGTRKPSDYSIRVASGIAGVLAGNGFDVISGFAEGIDIAAMMSAVKRGGRTYGVLGCGLEWVYPRSNARYRDVVASNGALISEYLPYTKPFPNNFLQRNRILSGLSMGLAVIEADENSGSLNSASHAAEQGRTVFAVPPCNLFDKRYKGNVMLIREGAVPLMGLRDIIDEYRSIIEHTIDNNKDEKLDSLDNINKRAEADRKNPKENQPVINTSHTAEKAESIPAVKSIEEITADVDDELQKKILVSLHASPKRADDMVELLSESVDDVLAALTELEITGLITAENGCYHIL